MQLNTTALVQETRRRLAPGWRRSENIGTIGAIEQGWRAWIFSVMNRMQFAGNTFGLIALTMVVEGLNDLASPEPEAKPVE